MADAAKIFDKILDFISNKPITTYQIVYGTKLNARTVKKYLMLIEKIQSSRKLIKFVKGARIFFRKE